MAPGDLTQFDDARPATLHDATWAENLAALHAADPELATRIEQTPPPSDWRPVESLDGFTTFRTEPCGQPPRWLADSAAPLTRAAALLPAYHPGENNATLPSIGNGAELTLLLRRLPPYKAVFVFERESAALAAVFRAVPLAEALTAGRCLIVPWEQEEARLAERLEQQPGLLPPGNILHMPHVPPDRIEAVRLICERVGRRSAKRRAVRLDQLVADLAHPRPSSTGLPRLAVLARAPTPAALAASGALTRAAEALRWEVLRCAVDGPQHVHVLAHLEALAAYAPTLTLCVGHGRAQLPFPLPGQTCEWYLADHEVPESLPDDTTSRLAATPAVAHALRTAGASDPHLLNFFWAHDPHPREKRGQDPFSREAVLLVADLPETQAQACGIDQMTHQRLWEKLRHTAERAWETPDIRSPQKLLRDAERASGVRLTAEAVRQQMLQLLERNLIPAVVVERILQTLEESGVPILVAGRGWRRVSDRVQVLTEDVWELDRVPADWQPQAVVFAGQRDPLTPALLCAAARAWPLLLHTPGGASLAPRLGKILHAEQHYQPFTGTKDLRAALHTLTEKPQQIARRAERARTHVLERHTYQLRLTALLGQLGLPSARDPQRP